MSLALFAAAEVAGTLNPPGSGTFTTIHFVLIGLLALATLLVIAAGMRKARARRDAERRSREQADEAGVPVVEAASAPPEQRSTHLSGQALDRSAFAPRFDPTPVPDNADTESVLDDAPPASAAPDERIPAAAPMDASPATMAEPEPVRSEPAQPAAPSPADGPVTQLKGLGPKVAARLAELGIVTVGDIAALDADQAHEVDAKLGPFAGRLHRDRWVEQARFLAAGDRAGFEAVFGRL